nr:ComEC/Rec2 family competence protein [Hyphomonas sp. Mor2]
MRRFPSSLLQFTSRDRLPSYTAIGMLSGAVWYFSIDFEPSFTGLLAGAASTGALAWWSRRLRRVTILFVLAVFGFATVLGALAGSLATQRLSHVQLDQPVGPVLVEGWIVNAEPARRGVRVVIRTHAIDGLAEDQIPKTVRLTHIARFSTEPGRFVRCWSVLRPPPAPVIEGDYAFDRQAWYSGLGAVGFVQGRCQGGVIGAPTRATAAAALEIGQARRRLAQHVRAAAGERTGGFAAALASGDRSFLSQTDQEALRGAGLAHLLAISGLHMGIVGGLVFVMVWRGLALIEPVALQGSTKKPAAIAALLVCATYLIISGASVSTQRAFVMAVILFGAVLIDRAALTQRSLAVAMIVIIVIAPWSVLTPGFQMSFAATLVLIATYEAWQVRRRAQMKPQKGAAFWLKSLLMTSCVTSLATMPFAIYHFERVAGLGIIANTLAMPIISLLSAPLAACALVLAPLRLDEPVLWAFGITLEWVLAIAHTVGAWSLFEPLRLPKMPAASLALFSVSMCVICLSRAGHARVWIAVGVALIAGLTWFASAKDRVHWAPSGDVFLEPAHGEIERIRFIAGDGLGPLRFSGLEERVVCDGVDVCQLSYRSQKIILYGKQGPVPCDLVSSADIVLTNARAPRDCEAGDGTLILNWSDVMRENGITLERRGNAFHKKRKPDCGNRPWRPCR